MAANDVYRLIVRFTNADAGKDVSFHIDGRQPGILAPSISSLGPDVEEWWQSGYTVEDAQKVHHDPAITWVAASLRRIKPLEAVETEYTPASPIAGTGTGGSLPPQCAMLFSMRTGNIGRSYRGRAYLPPPSVDQMDTSTVLNSTEAAEMDNGWDNLLAALTADQFTPCVFSGTLDLSTDVAATYLDRVIRTQRKRAKRLPTYVVG